MSTLQIFAVLHKSSTSLIELCLTPQRVLKRISQHRTFLTNGLEPTESPPTQSNRLLRLSFLPDQLQSSFTVHFPCSLRLKIYLLLLLKYDTRCGWKLFQRIYKLTQHKLKITRELELTWSLHVAGARGSVVVEASTSRNVEGSRSVEAN
jgi:hypothetical protein